jgi:uncharacterized protein
LDPSIVAQIQKQIDDTIETERVAIPLAIESGSRAWGFPSPDSDYDCRFIYVRKPLEYMSLFQKRDVIELPLTPVFDVNGWDLQKAIKLMLKGNAVILEWLQSPIVYRRDEAFCSQMLELAQEIVDRDAVRHHYCHLLEGTLTRHFQAADKPSVKKLFYVLRPAMALRQLRLQSALRFPDMSMQQMMSECELPQSMENTIQELLAKKAVTRELGKVTAPVQLMEFVQGELAKAKSLESSGQHTDHARVESAEYAFQSLVNLFANA